MTAPPLTAGGEPLDLSEEKFGWLTDSAARLGDLEGLREAMDRDGYLFLPGFFDPEEVMTVRRAILHQLATEGLLDPDSPVEEGIARLGIELAFRPDIANDAAVRPLLEAIIYGERMMAFWDAFFGEPARHYDFTWLRTVAPGRGTWPHCDSVFMNRGTGELYTAWLPISEVPLTTGGLILVENSHRDPELRRTYVHLDVDTRCDGAPDELSPLERAGFERSGAISPTIGPLAEKLKGRLLTAPHFHPGDLLLFSCYLVHGSLDNAGRTVRLSSDSRYQRASAPADERWVAASPATPPPGHGGTMVRETIC